jgi:predicted dehydrogenase
VQRRLSYLPPGHPQGYADCFAAFVADTYAAIRGERPDGLPSFADGLRAARIVDAVIRSAGGVRWTEV